MIKAAVLLVLMGSAAPRLCAQVESPQASVVFEHSLVSHSERQHHAFPIQSGAWPSDYDHGPNGWLVVGGVSLAFAIAYAVWLPQFFERLGVASDSTNSTWFVRAAYGTVIGAGLGLGYCVVRGCDWSRPGLPKPPEPRGALCASVLVGAGAIGMRVRW